MNKYVRKTPPKYKDCQCDICTAKVVPGHGGICSCGKPIRYVSKFGELCLECFVKTIYDKIRRAELE